MKLNLKVRRTLGIGVSALMLFGVLSGVTAVKAGAVTLYNSQASSYGVGVGSRCTVNTDVLNVRTGPGLHYTVSGHLTRGYNVTIEAENGGWGRIAGGGWVDLDYLRPTGSSGSSSYIAGTVNVPVLNVRSGPSTSYTVVGKLTNGYRVTIEKTQDGWGKISDGWVKLDYITGYGSGSSSSSGGTTVVPGGSSVNVNNEVTVTATQLNVRQGPGTGYAKVGSLDGGDRVTIQEIQGNWGRIGKGWISLNYVRGLTTSDGSSVSGGTTVRVTADSLRIRKGPGIQYTETGALMNGYQVVVERVQGDWGKISDGWINLNYVVKVR